MRSQTTPQIYAEDMNIIPGNAFVLAFTDSGKRADNSTISIIAYKIAMMNDTKKVRLLIRPLYKENRSFMQSV